MSISSFLTKKFLKSLFFPAHNRGKALPKGLIRLLKKQPGFWDLPELPEIGSPLSNSGLIHDAQISISKKVNAKKCFFGVNGASVEDAAHSRVHGPRVSRFGRFASQARHLV